MCVFESNIYKIIIDINEIYFESNKKENLTCLHLLNMENMLTVQGRDFFYLYAINK